MEPLLNEFTVHRSIEHTWAVLTDVERIAPCMKGAELQEIEGEMYRGVVKLKLGPIHTQFKGQAHFVERDDANHRAVLKGEGRDTGGKGNAEALITATLQAVSRMYAFRTGSRTSSGERFNSVSARSIAYQSSASSLSCSGVASGASTCRGVPMAMPAGSASASTSAIASIRMSFIPTASAACRARP